MTRRVFWLVTLAALGCRHRRHRSGEESAAGVTATADPVASDRAVQIPGAPTILLVAAGVVALALFGRRFR